MSYIELIKTYSAALDENKVLAKNVNSACAEVAQLAKPYYEASCRLVKQLHLQIIEANQPVPKKSWFKRR